MQLVNLGQSGEVEAFAELRFHVGDRRGLGFDFGEQPSQAVVVEQRVPQDQLR